MNNLLPIYIISFALTLYTNPSLAEQAEHPKTSSSSAAFQKFLSSSPDTKKAISQAKLDESISAACFNSGTSRHNGTTIKRDGTIYTWIMPDSDDKEIRHFVTKNKTIADEIFASKAKLDFSSETLDYKVDGTSYCYVRIKSGSNQKQINWPKNEIMTGHKKVPPATKELFATITETTLKSQQGNPSKP